jgi:2-phosphosulfolactate phosphatase
VVVDVLRATTTLTVALANGARGVELFSDPARAMARAAGAADVLACGERGGRIVPGFALGNSPFEFTPERVAGQTLAFASSNGSLALLAAAGCARRILGAFVNATAVLERVIAATPRYVWVACSGRDGHYALEDTALAGWLCAELARRGATLAGAEARLALSLAPRDPGEVRALVEGSTSGRTLRRLSPDYARDVEFCAGFDRTGTVFEL